MGKAESLRVVLHGGRLVYYPGEVVSGDVSFSLGGAASSWLRAVHAKCVGRCQVSQKGGGSSSEPEATEQYVRLALLLWKKDSSGALGSGNHSFTFHFPLPSEPCPCPTSFEGRFGRVEYSVQAVLEAAWYRADQSARTPLYVLNPLDLNLLPDCRCPSVVEVQKKVNYSLFKSATVTLAVTSDLRGYVPGQVIHLTCLINNGTGKSVSGITATLVQKVTFRGRCVMYDMRTLAQLEGGSVGARQQAQWLERIALPPLPQSQLFLCHLIDVDYFVQVAIRSIGVAATLPIVVGNVPVLRSLGPGPATALTPTAPPLPPPTAPGYGGGGGGDGRLYEASATALPTKLHSQLQDGRYFPTPTHGDATIAGASGGALAPLAPVPPAAPFGVGAPQLCLAPGETVPFFSGAAAGATAGAAAASSSHHPLLLPPEFSAALFPYDPPPSYEESCQAASGDAAQMDAAPPDPRQGGSGAGGPWAPCGE
ncbi:arrestin domain-containing protein 1-like [Lampetra fluviatilis]